MKYIAVFVALTVPVVTWAQSTPPGAADKSTASTVQPAKKKAASTTIIEEAPSKSDGKPVPPANKVERDPATGKTCSGQDQYRVCW